MAVRYYYRESSGQEAIVSVSGGTPLLYPRHMHMRHWTLGLVRRGMVELESPAGMRRLDMGVFFLVPPRMPHSLRVAGNTELLALCFAEEQRRAGSKMRTLAQRLVAQPEETLSVPDMARIACVSPWHFLRRFQSEIGMTPHAFLLNCKIRRLRSLLRGGVVPVDAAVLTGFADQSHMHKLFKLHHNLTPRQFVLASSTLDDAACLRPHAVQAFSDMNLANKYRPSSLA